MPAIKRTKPTKKQTIILLASFSFMGVAVFYDQILAPIVPIEVGFAFLILALLLFLALIGWSVWQGYKEGPNGK